MPYLTDPAELAELLPGEPAFRADQLRSWLYETPVLEAEEMTNLPAELRESLAGRLWPFSVEAEQVAAHGNT